MMIQKAYRILLVLVFSTSVLYSQNNYEIIENITYSVVDNSEFDDRVGLRIEALENGFVTLSKTFESEKIIAKHDSSGKIIWEKSLDFIGINDIKVFDHYIYAVGYKFLKQRKAWIAKIDTNGNVIWETILKFQYDNDIQNLTISESGDIFVIGEIQKALSPVKISLRRRMYRFITFRTRDKRNLENEICIAGLDTTGNLKWKKKFGKQKDHNHYFSCAISANSSELLASFYFFEKQKKQRKEGTRLIRMNYSGKILNELNHSNRLFKVIIPDDSDFYTVEGNLNSRLNINDTIHISRLSDDTLEICKRYISDYDIYDITALIRNEANELYAGGYVGNYETPGSLCSNHHDIYIAKYDPDFKMLWNFIYDQGSLDQINDMKMIDGKLYAIGENWYEENNHIKKRMRILILK